MFDPLVALATFAVIFPAELPDKSMFAAVVMGTRFRALPVWIGLASGFLFHVVIAVIAGGVVSLLPERVVTALVGLLFLAGALWMLLGRSEAPSETETEDEGQSAAPRTTSSIVAAAFGVVFVSEWGDLTQLATINMTARYDDPFSVAVGALSALWLVCGLGVLLGRRLVRSIPLQTVRRFSGLVLLGLAIWTAVDFFKM